MADHVDSPFPGMDPYLEHPGYWRDFHGEMILACRSQILDQLSGTYDAGIEVQPRLFEVEEGDTVPQDRYADVSVHAPRHWSPAAADEGAGGVATAVATAPRLEPTTVRVPLVRWEERERWIEIVRLPDRRIVTVIQLLIPTNKNGDGYRDYQ